MKLMAAGGRGSKTTTGSLRSGRRLRFGDGEPLKNPSSLVCAAREIGDCGSLLGMDGGLIRREGRKEKAFAAVAFVLP